MYCKYCGKQINDTSNFCVYCGKNLRASAAPSPQNNTLPSQPVPRPAAPAVSPTKPQKLGENVLMGHIGAFLGAFVVGIFIVVVTRLGTISTLFGTLLPIATMYGYIHLGKGFSWKALPVCIALTAATPYVANRVVWALALLDADMSASILDAYTMVEEELGYAISRSAYKNSQEEMYLFTGFGVIFMLWQLIKGLIPARKEKK